MHSEDSNHAWIGNYNVNVYFKTRIKTMNWDFKQRRDTPFSKFTKINQGRNTEAELTYNMKASWRETRTRILFWDSASLAYSRLLDQSFGRDNEDPCNSGTRETLKLMILKGYLVTFCLYSNPWLTTADFLESLCMGQWLASGELTVAMLKYILHLTHFLTHTSWENGIF